MHNYVKKIITTDGTVCDIQESYERITTGSVSSSTGLWDCVKYPDGYTVIDFTMDILEHNLTFNQWGAIYSHDWNLNIPFPTGIPTLTELYEVSGSMEVSGLVVIASIRQNSANPINSITGFTAIRGADAPIMDRNVRVFVHMAGMRTVT